MCFNNVIVLFITKFYILYTKQRQNALSLNYYNEPCMLSSFNILTIPVSAVKLYL